MAQPTPRRISELDVAGPLTGAEQLVFDQNNRTVKGTIETVKAFTDTSCQCTLVSRYNEVSSSGISGIEYLSTYTLPGGTVSTDGSWLHIIISGYFAANANTKSVRFTILSGSTTAFNYSTTSPAGYNDMYWEMEFKIQRSSATTYTVNRKMTLVTAHATSVITNNPLMWLDNDASSSYTDLWANDLYFRLDCQDTTAGDIVFNSMIIKLNKLDADS